MEVLRLALRLNIPRLRGLCARFLRANLCYSNVLPALHAAHHANLSSVKEYCLRFLVKDYNFTPIVMSAEFESMEQSLMVEVIRRRQQPPAKLTGHQEVVEDITGFTNNRLQVFCKHNLQSNVTPENVLAILQAADRMRATDIKEYALKMIVHHFPLVARQESIRVLAQPLLVDIVMALAEERRTDTPLPLQPRSLPSSSSADTLTDDHDYINSRF
ncbi:hypothetical protein MSG28_005715 [Choristoneura fumiferana]|nr:hypothetical protein MSG28_005715 [Choristoneura fumiferana]